MAQLDAVTMLDDEHNQVIRLFELYKSKRDDRQRMVLAPRICRELEIHMQIEEEIFYPAYRAATGDEAVLADSRQEHEDARKLIARVRDDARNARLMLELEDAILHPRGSCIRVRCRLQHQGSWSRFGQARHGTGGRVVRDN